MIKAFPKIFAYGSKPVLNILKDSIEVTEKLDGSQFNFGMVNDRLVCRSKGKVMDLNYPDKMFVEAVEYTQRIASKLPPDRVFYAEYMKKPKHNTLKYEGIPKNHLMLFGTSTIDGIFEADYDELRMWGDILGVDVAPLLWSGPIGLCSISPDPLIILKQWLTRESFLGGCKIEGVVVKNYMQSILVGEVYFPIMSAKFVSEEFKEVHGATWKGDHTAKGGYEQLKERYCSEARWIKAVNRLRDEGTLTEQPQDIGALIKTVHTDLIEEEKESIKDALWALFHKEMLGASTRGLPEWYKERLVKEAYSNE